MKSKATALGLLVIVSLPLAANASLLQGVLNITGTVDISLGSVAFEGNTYSINSPASAQTGDFMALAGTAGTIQSVTSPPSAVGPLDIPNFMTFTAAPNISITLTFLFSGSDGDAQCFSAPAAGQQCTPDIPQQSPYNLNNTTANSSTASFNISGLELDSLTSTTIPISGLFSTQFPTQNFQTLLAIVNGGGTVTTSFSASFATVAASAPEPATWIELVIGAGGIGLAYRRRAAFRI